MISLLDRMYFVSSAQILGILVLVSEQVKLLLFMSYESWHVSALK